MRVGSRTGARMEDKDKTTRCRRRALRGPFFVRKNEFQAYPPMPTASKMQYRANESVAQMLKFQHLWGSESF